MTDLADLTSAISTERDLAVKIRMMAVRAVREHGQPIGTASKIFDVTPRCIRQWLQRFDRDGPDGLRDRPRPGRPPAVMTGRISGTAMSLYGEAGLIPKKLASRIREACGVAYSVAHVRHLLRSTGFSRRVPTLVHVNAAGNEECERWYEETAWAVLRLKRRGFVVLVQDESFFVNDVRKGYKLWGPVGERTYMPYAGSHSKVAVYGAVAEDGTYLFRAYEKFDTATFLRYADCLRRKYGKVMIITDGAGPHRSNAVRDYLAKHHRTVAIRRLPVASPHLNATDEYWHQSKREILASEYYDSFDALRKRITEYFRTVRFNLDLYEYLRRRIAGNYLSA